MTVREVTQIIEAFAPLSYQESFDNTGLCLGTPEQPVRGILLCVDVTDAVLEEARTLGANLIISHHPLIFQPLKQLTNSNRVQRLVAQAIRNDIALYAAHTNLDSVFGGVSCRMAQKLRLQEIEILAPTSGNLVKLATYVPQDSAERVRKALFKAGAGSATPVSRQKTEPIAPETRECDTPRNFNTAYDPGNYDQCSFNVGGFGTFRAAPGAHPFVGDVGAFHQEPEIRIETLAQRHQLPAILNALLETHPYEEPVYDLIPLENRNAQWGFGAIGNLPHPETVANFLTRLKETFELKVIRHTKPSSQKISRVALSSGSGASMLTRGLACGADIFVTGDLKMNDFFSATTHTMIADIGHYESEKCAVDILFDVLTKKITTFAIHKTKLSTNPIIYSV